MAAYEQIESNEALEKLCLRLAVEKELAIDLEADSMHHYREKVCLIQISTRHSTWLVDPLVISNFEPLAVLLANENILSVFHGGDYDIRSLHRDFGIKVANMFDTMIAAQFIGVTEFGLAALLKSHYGLELDKRFQKADWSRRPLTGEMANYAADDTAHLLKLAKELADRLEQLGRASWVAEECGLVAGNRMVDKGDGPLFMHCKGAGKLPRRNLAILEELLRLRDQQARDADRPPFKILPTESLMDIAERCIDNVQDLSSVKGLSERLINRYSGNIILAVKRGLELPENRLPKFPRGKGEPNHGIKARINALKKWRESFSSKLDLASGLLAPNWLLERIAEQQPKTVGELAQIQGLRAWQKALWGDELLAILHAVPEASEG
jgi:ribonuclease D